MVRGVGDAEETLGRRRGDAGVRLWPRVGQVMS